MKSPFFCCTTLARMLVCVVCVTVGPAAPAGDWPGFRGPNANGISDGEKAPTTFGPGKNLLWKTEAPSGLSSPVISKDRLFITAEEGNTLSTVAFDTRTGKKLWTGTVEVQKLESVHKVNSHASSTPVTDGKRVYVYFGSFGLVAYDFEGKEAWRKPLPMPKTFFNQGSSTSPVLAEDKLILFVQVGSDSHLLAVDPSDGKELWQARMAQYNNSWATPVVWKENGKGLVGMSCAMRFTAFSLADGKEAWWVDGLSYQACSTPVPSANGDRLLIAVAGVQGELSNITPPPAFDEMVKKYDTDKDGLIALEEVPADLLYTDRQASDGKGNMPLRQALGMFGGVKKGDKVDEKKWEEIRSSLVGFRTGPMNRTAVLCVRTGGENDVSKSHIAWKETKGVPEVPSPLVLKDRAYLVRSGGLLVCRDLESGKLVYEERLDAPGGYFASPVSIDGRIYVASDGGTVTVIRAGDKLNVLARNDLGESIMASPAVAGNTLYIRSAKQLWAFKEN